MAYNYEYPYVDSDTYNDDWLINQMKEMVIEWAKVKQDWTTQQEAFESLRKFVTEYFDNLDVQEEINNKINELYNSGELLTLIQPSVVSATGDWLKDNMNTSSLPIDKSLMVENAAAESATVGRQLQVSNVYNYVKYNAPWTSSVSGIEVNGNGWTISLVGTTTASMSVTIESTYAYTTDLAWLESGKRYYVNIDKVGTGNVHVRLVGYKGNAGTKLFDSALSGVFNMPDKTEYDGFILRLYSRAGNYLNCTITLTIGDSMTNYGLSYLELKNIPLGQNFEAYSPYNLIPNLIDMNGVINGITYTTNQNTITFSGTSTATAVLNILDSYTNTNDFNWLKSSTPYYIHSKKNGSGDIVIRFNAYIGNTAYILYEGMGNGVFAVEDVSKYDGFILRVYIPKNTTVNATTSIAVLKNPFFTQRNSTSPVRLRIMENNIGRFNWGSLTGGLSEAQYQQKLGNYKNLYQNEQVDILFLQEYTQYMDEADTHATYDVLYKDIFTSFSTPSLPSGSYKILTNIHTFTSNRIPVNGISVNTTMEIVLGEINNLPVLLVSGALDSLVADVNERLAQLNNLLNYANNWMNVIIGIDLNVASEDELNSLIAVAESEGFVITNGGYYGYQETYVPQRGIDYYKCIDSFILKGNFKFTASVVLTEEYDLLASDHIPLVGDLVLF